MAKRVTVAATDTESFQLAASYGNGNSVVVEVTYPKDHALDAINALRQFGEAQSITSLLSTFRKDPSVAKALSDRHIGFDDDDDDY